MPLHRYRVELSFSCCQRFLLWRTNSKDNTKGIQLMILLFYNQSVNQSNNFYLWKVKSNPKMSEGAVLHWPTRVKRKYKNSWEKEAEINWKMAFNTLPTLTSLLDLKGKLQHRKQESLHPLCNYLSCRCNPLLCCPQNDQKEVECCAFLWNGGMLNY